MGELSWRLSSYVLTGSCSKRVVISSINGEDGKEIF